MSFKKLQSRLLISLGLGLSVVLILALLSDAQAVGSSLQQFQWHLLPLIVGLTLINYVLRWLKWDFYLRYMQMHEGVSHLIAAYCSPLEWSCRLHPARSAKCSNPTC